MLKRNRTQARREEGGLTLATTLVVVALALILGLALSSASLTHLHQSRHQVKQALAENAAEAVLAEACERLVGDPEFGISGIPEQSLSLVLDGSQSHLTFNQATAESLGVPVSVSNRFGVEPENASDGGVVPPYSVRLYALGEHDGTFVTLEGVISAPEFPYVVASSGPIESQGALVVGTASDIEEAVEVDRLTPAALASNGAVTINGRAQVRGNVESAESVTIGPNVTVTGELRPHSAPIEFQDLDIPSLRPATTVPLNDTISPELDGRYHHNGPSLVITGGLTMDDCVLYVNGDARIRGGIVGKGAVIANGDLIVEGSSSLAAINQVALVAQGDLRVEGQTQDSSFFQGLVYTEGDFFAEDVTLVGAFLANKPADATEPGSRIQLQNASIIELEQYSTFDLDAVPFLIWDDGSPNNANGSGILNLLEVDEQDFPTLLGAVTAWREGPGIHGTGSPTVEVMVDYAAIQAVTRGRRARVANGKLVSDWEELTADRVLEILELTQPPRVSKSEGHSQAPEANLALLNFQATPDSPFWNLVQASFHLDLNEFLGVHDRIRRTSWRRLR